MAKASKKSSDEKLRVVLSVLRGERSPCRPGSTTATSAPMMPSISQPPPAPPRGLRPRHLRLAGAGEADDVTIFARSRPGLALGRRRASALRKRPISRPNVVPKVELRHISLIKSLFIGSIVVVRWRREGDSNPRDP